MTLLHSYGLCSKFHISDQKLLPIYEGEDKYEIKGIKLLQFLDPNIYKHPRVINVPIESEEAAIVKSRFETKMMYFDVYKSYFVEGNDDMHMLIVQSELKPEFIKAS